MPTISAIAHSGRRGIGTVDESMPNAVDLNAAERQNKRLILPGFEGFRMPRFYFNILSEAGSLDDWEGTELANLDAARIEAVRDARALMSNAVLLGYDIASRSIEIRNETGDILLVLPFSETVKRLG
ncbi:DUF6894 family protein [Rhizobium ruizarguesonis]|uniref:DUF6894 family protein n=1 Tax=Rhizobium ruizarguesonis TaxID=2081791 RepID=UPI001FE1DE07|nr:hypothetical protein [Rhizobium ruizarguesonis]